MSAAPPPFQEAVRCDVCNCNFNTFRRRVLPPTHSSIKNLGDSSFLLYMHIITTWFFTCKLDDYLGREKMTTTNHQPFTFRPFFLVITNRLGFLSFFTVLRDLVFCGKYWKDLNIRVWSSVTGGGLQRSAVALFNGLGNFWCNIVIEDGKELKVSVKMVVFWAMTKVKWYKWVIW